MTDDDRLTLKQAMWEGQKLINRMERRMPRGVATTIATVRKKPPCTCGHTRKHHKKSGRCRGKVLDPQQTERRKIAGGFGIPARLVNVPASCPCGAGVRV